MAIGLTVEHEPEALCLSRNPVWYRFLTDNYLTTAAVAAVVDITIPSGVSVGSEFTLIINEKRYTFTCVSSYTANGYSFLSYSDAITFAITVQNFADNYYLNRHYAITGSYGTNKIRLTAKQAGTKWNVQMENATGGISITQVTAGVDAVYKSNYKAFLDLNAQSTYLGNPDEDLMAQLEADAHQDDVTSALDPDEFVFDFELQEFLHSRLSAHVPAYNLSTPEQAASILQNYWVRYGEIYGDDPVINFNYSTGAAATYKQVIMGGWKVDDDHEALCDELADLEFLNRQPRTKVVATDSKEYLYKYMAASHSNLTLRYRITYSDNTTNTGSYGTVVASSLAKAVYAFPAGWDMLNLGSVQPSKTAVKYELWVTNNAVDTLSEVMTYLIDRRHYEDSVQLIFLGQCGAMETVWCHGYQQTKVESQSITYQKAIMPWHTKGQQHLSDTLNYQNDQITLITGYKTKQYIEWLKNLMNSPTVLLHDSDGWAAVRVIKESLTLPTELDDMYCTEFKIQRLTFI